MINKHFLRGTAAAAILTIAASGAQANLVVNGDFETGNFTGWSKSGNLSLSDVIANTVTSNHTFLWRSGATGSPAIISQALATTAGATYTLEFDLYNTATQNAAFAALFDGVNVFTSTNTPLNWMHFSFSGLKATGASTLLSFSARNDPSFYRLDNIVVTADARNNVPEPGSVALTLAALLLAAAAMRRRA